MEGLACGLRWIRTDCRAGFSAATPSGHSEAAWELTLLTVRQLTALAFTSTAHEQTHCPSRFPCLQYNWGFVSLSRVLSGPRRSSLRLRRRSAIAVETPARVSHQPSVPVVLVSLSVSAFDIVRICIGTCRLSASSRLASCKVSNRCMRGHCRLLTIRSRY